MRMIRVLILLLPVVLIQTDAATARPAARKTAKKAPVYRGFNPSGPWLAPDYSNPAEGDQVDGDDLAVRRAAAAKENSTTRRTARASGKAENRKDAAMHASSSRQMADMPKRERAPQRATTAGLSRNRL